MRYRTCLLLALPLGLALLYPTPVAAQEPEMPEDCYPICKTACLKPWSIPDRWDDSGRPGWPKWNGNKHWDSEQFTDVNGNGLYDIGEPFQDGVDTNKGTGPQDGQYTAESYDPNLTGYFAGRDLGQLMTFKLAHPQDAAEPGQFYPLDLCRPDGGCTGGDVYRWNIGECNPMRYGPGGWVPIENGNMIGATQLGLVDLIAADPDAYWDAACRCVKGSTSPGGRSPRIAILALHDPRIPLTSGKMQLQIVKLVAMFLEPQSASGDLVGRFVRAQAPDGERCDAGRSSGGYLYDCAMARAFLRGGDRVTRLASGRPATCVQVEPIAGAFRLADLDPQSVLLRPAAGGETIPGTVERADKDRDTDHNGVDEATVCFAKEDLRRAFAAVSGSATVPVTLSGRLLPGGPTTRTTWSADLEMEVVGRETAADATLATTPLSGAVRICFATAQPGAARVRVYDVRGRLVRTLLDAPLLPAGEHETVWDRRDATGAPLRHGVYFYRVESAAGARTGRVAIVG